MPSRFPVPFVSSLSAVIVQRHALPCAVIALCRRHLESPPTLPPSQWSVGLDLVLFEKRPQLKHWPSVSSDINGEARYRGRDRSATNGSPRRSDPDRPWGREAQMRPSRPPCRVARAAASLRQGKCPGRHASPETAPRRKRQRQGSRISRSHRRRRQGSATAISAVATIAASGREATPILASAGRFGGVARRLKGPAILGHDPGFIGDRALDPGIRHRQLARRRIETRLQIVEPCFEAALFLR
jgi:hypothetical protein